MVYPIIHRVSTIQGGAGFLPFTVRQCLGLPRKGWNKAPNPTQLLPQVAQNVAMSRCTICRICRVAGELLDKHLGGKWDIPVYPSSSHFHWDDKGWCFFFLPMDLEVAYFQTKPFVDNWQRFLIRCCSKDRTFSYVASVWKAIKSLHFGPFLASGVLEHPEFRTYIILYLYQFNSMYIDVYEWWVKQCHKPSPSHHHKYIGAIMVAIPSHGWLMMSRQHLNGGGVLRWRDWVAWDTSPTIKV